MTSATTAAAYRLLARSRRSCRRFLPDREIPSNILQDILETTMRSPSSFNLQPYQVIMVRNAKLKDQLAEEAMMGPGNQYRTKDCSALAVFLSDLEVGKRIPRIQHLEQEWGQRHPNYVSTLPLNASFLLGEGHAATLVKQISASIMSEMKQPMPTIDPILAWSSKNAGILVQSYVMAATSHGLATSMMEGFDTRRTRRILKVPDRYAVPIMVATGYDYEDVTEDMYTPRLNLNDIVFSDQFGAAFNADSDNEPAK